MENQVKFVPVITAADVGYGAPLTDAPPINIGIYADSTVMIQQTVAYAVPKDAYAAIALRIKEDVQLTHLPAMNHRRREIVLRMASSPLCGTRSLEWFIERVYRRYAENRLRPADYIVTTFAVPYSDYGNIR